MKKKPRVSVERVTPDTAAKWLDENNPRNRPMAPNTVRRYATFITEKRWQTNGETIVFDWDGNVLNGQHRLAAVCLAQESCEFIIVRGVDPACFPTMDRGKPRSAADVLAILGYVNCTALAAGLAAARALKAGKLKIHVVPWTTVDPDEAAAVIAQFPRMPDSIAIGRAANVAVGANRAACAGLHCLASQSGLAAEANLFFADVTEGLNLRAGSPALALRKALLAQQHVIGNAGMRTALMIEAWNAFIRGDSVTKLEVRIDVSKADAFQKVLLTAAA